jgi:uncharacterized protein (DUF1501 family)
VTIGFGRWDYHNNNFGQCRERLPKLDSALSTLIEDIHMRVLDKDVSVVVWREFGRTPKIDRLGGRDHWPKVSCAMLACGGLRTGQVIGRTNALAEVPKDRPVTFQNVFATLYHQLGIPAGTTISDALGRPMYLLDDFEPIRELISWRAPPPVKPRDSLGTLDRDSKIRGPVVHRELPRAGVT